MERWYGQGRAASFIHSFIHSDLIILDFPSFFIFGFFFPLEELWDGVEDALMMGLRCLDDGGDKLDEESRNLQKRRPKMMEKVDD